MLGKRPRERKRLGKLNEFLKESSYAELKRKAENRKERRIWMRRTCKLHVLKIVQNFSTCSRVYTVVCSILTSCISTLRCAYILIDCQWELKHSNYECPGYLTIPEKSLLSCPWDSNRKSLTLWFEDPLVDVKLHVAVNVKCATALHFRVQRKRGL